MFYETILVWGLVSTWLTNATQGMFKFRLQLNKSY